MGGTAYFLYFLILKKSSLQINTVESLRIHEVPAHRVGGNENNETQNEAFNSSNLKLNDSTKKCTCESSTKKAATVFLLKSWQWKTSSLRGPTVSRFGAVPASQWRAPEASIAGAPWRLHGGSMCCLAPGQLIQTSREGGHGGIIFLESGHGRRRTKDLPLLLQTSFDGIDINKHLVIACHCTSLHIIAPPREVERSGATMA